MVLVCLYKYLHLTVLVGWNAMQTQQSTHHIIEYSRDSLRCCYCCCSFISLLNDSCTFCNVYATYWNWLSLGEISKWNTNQLTSFHAYENSLNSEFLLSKRTHYTHHLNSSHYPIITIWVIFRLPFMYYRNVKQQREFICIRFIYWFMACEIIGITVL